MSDAQLSEAVCSAVVASLLCSRVIERAGQQRAERGVAPRSRGLCVHYCAAAGRRRRQDVGVEEGDPDLDVDDVM